MIFKYMSALIISGIFGYESNITMKRKFEYWDIGIVVIACVLNLISGGFKARGLGFIPQCVF